GITRVAFGGVRALPSNFGRDTNTDMSFLSESGIELGLQVTKHISVRGGYNILWWSDVLRPGTVVSPIVTGSQVPIDRAFGQPLTAPGRPVVVSRSGDLRARGVVLGLLGGW